MNVEVFDQTGMETAPEHTGAALELIDQLGLEGQKALNTPRSEGEDAPRARFPWRELTDVERNVYGILCPAKGPASAYRAGPIPLRVLEVIKAARPMFDELEIWCADSLSTKGPVLVGVRIDPNNTWQRTQFILARWGTELKDFASLLKDAAIIRREEIRARLREIKQKLDAAAVESGVPDSAVVGRSLPHAYF